MCPARRDAGSGRRCPAALALLGAARGGLVPSCPMTWLDALADKAIDCVPPTREEALAVLGSSDDDLMDVVAAAFRVRRQFFGRRVKLNYLVNIKSGLCPEDCFYCSQRVGSGADVLKYSWLKTDEVLASAEAGVAGGARRVCLVARGRGPAHQGNDRGGSAAPRLTW